tara:strand:+ start:170 stop:457 length:288 start_codon:yes stop_codon:yes gene_type:complete
MPRRRSIEASRIIPSLSQALEYLLDPSSYYKTVTIRCFQDTGRSISGTPRNVQIKKTGNSFDVFVEDIFTIRVANNFNARSLILNHLHDRRIFLS